MNTSIDYKEIDINQYETYDKYILACRQALRRIPHLTPEIVIRLYQGIAASLQSSSILVPNFAMGYLSFELGKKFEVESLCRNESENRIAKKYSFKQYGEEPNKKYDFICADLPFNRKEQMDLVELLHFCLDRLAKGGIYDHTFHGKVSWERHYTDMIETAKGFGLYVSAVIDLPEKSYVPCTDIDTKILVFDTEHAQKHFIARIENEETVEAVLKYYFDGVSAKRYSLGTWVDSKEYFDVHDFEIQLEVSKLGKKYNGKIVPLKSIALKMSRPNRDSQFEEVADSIYIPRIGVSEVVESVEDFRISPHNYYQVVLDANVVSAQYVCFYLNSAHGIETRKNSMTGLTIPQLSRGSLDELPIVVPSIDEQNNMMTTQKNLKELRAQLDSLQAEFDRKPSAYVTINKGIKDINNHQTNEAWAETLPFPLASVLRRYYTETTYGKKQEALLLFFEAYSIYNACVMLSLLNISEELDDICVAFNETDNSYYRLSNFGSWAFLNKLITNCVLSIIEKSENRGAEGSNTLMNCFGTKNVSLLRALCNREVNKIITKIAVKRNHWKGHTGMTNEKLCESHVVELENCLAELRSLITDSFDDLELVHCLGMHYENEQFECSAELLRGSNSLFMKENFISEKPMDESNLYIVMRDTGKVIPMIPLVILRATPDSVKNACYFYNRDDGKGNQTYYVSYHYESEAMPEPGHQALEAITRFVPEKITDQ